MLQSSFNIFFIYFFRYIVICSIYYGWISQTTIFNWYKIITKIATKQTADVTEQIFSFY